MPTYLQSQNLRVDAAVIPDINPWVKMAEWCHPSSL